MQTWVVAHLFVPRLAQYLDKHMSMAMYIWRAATSITPLIFGGKLPFVERDASRLNLSRNLGVVIAFMVLFCFIHLMAAEFVSGQRPKGDVLIFRRYSNSGNPRKKDIEEAPCFVGSADSEVLKNIKSSDRSYDVPIDIAKQTSILTWDGLSYDIKVKNKVKRLLDEVDGWVKPGTLTALMVSLKRKDLCS